MLDDLKSFFATSSVVEVGVGVTIGVAFAALVAAITDSGRALLAGEPEWSGLVQAVLTLLTVAAVSVFGIVRPVMALKRRMTEVQSGAVADAVAQARSGDLAGAAAAGAALVTGSGRTSAGAVADGEAEASEATAASDHLVSASSGALVEGDVQDAASVTGATGWPVDGELAADGATDNATDSGPAADGLAGTGSDAAAGSAQDGAAAVDGSGRVLDPLTAPFAFAFGAAAASSGSNGHVADGAHTADGSTAAGADGVDADAETLDPASDGMLVSAGAPADALGATAALNGGAAAQDGGAADLNSGAGALDGSAAPLNGSAAGPGADGTGVTDPATSSAAGSDQPAEDRAVRAPEGHPGPPTSITALAPCPYCAFDIPAVATRCGWCTSELGDLAPREATVPAA